MLRTLPVDSSRLALLSTGDVEAVVDWIDDPANPGRRKPGEQSREEGTGLPVWRVHVLVPGGEGGRPELVAVQVPAPAQPEVTAFAPVAFERLECRVAVGRDNRLAGYWAAAGVAQPQHQGHQGGRKGHQGGEEQAA